MHLLQVAFTCSITCLLLQTRFNIFLHYFLQRFTANVFSVWGTILHIMDEQRHVGWIWENEMKVKRDKIVLIVGGICQTFSNDTNPCTRAPKPTSFSTLLSPKRDSMTQFQQVGPSKFLSRCCRCFSKILMSQKYHNIKNKCNPFTKQ